MKLYHYSLLGLFLGVLFCNPTPSFASVSTLVADTRSGFVFDSKDADIQKPPASLTKLMTLYLMFEALDNGILTMDQDLLISKHAARQPRSKLYLKEGETISVEEAIFALIIKSANDVAVVVSETLASSEDEFAEMMTQTAHTLGMKQTVFKNASGLHQEGQLTTARDMAILTMALIDHYPQYYRLFATPSFSYKGKTYGTHNVVLQEYDGAEGLKTGFVSAVGYNVVSTAKKGDARLVSVVIGDDSPLRRDLKAMRLLDRGFHQVRIQQRAEESGDLKAPFNPLNRKAFISRPPVQMYLPMMQASIKRNQARLARLQKKEKGSSIRLAKAVPSNRKIPHQVPSPVWDVAVEQGDGWAIQVGAFEGKSKAHQIAQEALSVLGCEDKKIQTPRASNQFFRSRILGFPSKAEAFKACKQLKNNRWQCFLVSPKH